MASELLKTFEKIDLCRKECIRSLNTMNVPIDENSTFYEISDKIKKVNGDIDSSKENLLWQRPEEWPDTKELLLNAPELEGYTPFAIHLLHDNRDTITLKLGQLSTVYTNVFDAFYLSDGTFITNPGTSATEISHTWDKEKDIKTTLGYNLRYVIEYGLTTKINSLANSTTKGMFTSQSNYGIGISLLETVYNSDAMKKDSIIYLPYRASTDSCCNLLRLHIIGENNLSFSGTYQNILREIQVDKHGELKWGLWTAGESTSYPMLRSVLIPNATKLDIGVGSSGRIMGGCYLYIPNVEEIYRASGSYGNINTNILYAPKLKALDPNVSISCNKDSIMNLSNLEDLSQVSLITTTILNPVIYKHKKDVINYPGTNSSNGYYWFNEISKIFNLVNKSSYVYTHSVYLPNVTQITPVNAFVDSTYAARIRMFVIGKGFKSSLNLSSIQYIPTIEILGILNNLADVTDEDLTYTLTLNNKIKGILTNDEKAIATNKGWVIE